jgi:hypothetical protein
LSDVLDMIFSSAEAPDRLTSWAHGLTGTSRTVEGDELLERPRKLRRQNECRNRIGTGWISDRDYRRDWTRSSLALTSLPPGHTWVSSFACTGGGHIQPHGPRTCTPLVRALALHGVPENIGSHFGSTLMPGRAVLTRGVFRRSGSVAYVRADASPSEVLADLMMTPHAAHVNPIRGARQAVILGYSINRTWPPRRQSAVVIVSDAVPAFGPDSPDPRVAGAQRRDRVDSLDHLSGVERKLPGTGKARHPKSDWPLPRRGSWAARVSIGRGLGRSGSRRCR